MKYDVVVVGGGPSGATAAEDLTRSGHTVALIDRAGRIKPCGGAIPPRLIADFNIPDDMIIAKITTAQIKGVDLKVATAALRESAGLTDCKTIRREGAPIPLKPLDVWDNGRDVVLAGDAAGVVAPSSGEGIYYAMVGGRVAATAAAAKLQSGMIKDLQLARKLFMKEHKSVFKVLGAMQNAYYKSDERRERFVSLCHDVDVQKLTFEAYMNKSLVKARPMAHIKIGIKNVSHLLGLVQPARV